MRKTARPAVTPILLKKNNRSKRSNNHRGGLKGNTRRSLSFQKVIKTHCDSFRGKKEEGCQKQSKFPWLMRRKR